MRRSSSKSASDSARLHGHGVFGSYMAAAQHGFFSANACSLQSPAATAWRVAQGVLPGGGGGSGGGGRWACGGRPAARWPTSNGCVQHAGSRPRPGRLPSGEHRAGCGCSPGRPAFRRLRHGVKSISR